MTAKAQRADFENLIVFHPKFLIRRSIKQWKAADGQCPLWVISG
jgi:hypothetical protein